MTLRRGLATLLALAAALFAACASDDDVVTQDIVGRIPWTAPESHTYRITDDDGEEDRGTLTLRIEREGDVFVLTQEAVDDEGNSDTAIVRTDASTLKPRSATRTIVDAKADRKAMAEAEYTTGDDGREIVRIRETNYKPADSQTPDSTRSNPLRVPEHAYDNHASLFIWRTIAFEAGYTVTYHTVFSNTRETARVTLRVKARERVRTGAGEADAWLVEIETGGKKQKAWFATSGDHRLLVYDNGKDVFVLAAAGGQ